MVELLVVVSLLAILTAYLVPQLKTINKDRNIREAARVVGSFFTEAIQRAKTDGAAGILIERNPNYVDLNDTQSAVVKNGAQFAGMTLYLLRNVPAYAGEFPGEETIPTATPNVIRIRKPYEHEEGALPLPRRIIRVNDHLFLNNRKFGYRITSVVQIPPNPPIDPNSYLELTIDFGSFPAPPFGTLPFVIKRQPRKVISSQTVVPKGHMIDLRFSGAFDNGTAQEMYFTKTAHLPDPPQDIKIFFDEDGRTDRIYFGDDVSTNDESTFGYVPNGTLHLLITQDGLDLLPGQDQLMDPSNLWVTISNQSGNVNVANISPQTAPTMIPMPPMEFQNRLNASRVLSRSRKSAEQ